MKINYIIPNKNLETKFDLGLFPVRYILLSFFTIIYIYIYSRKYIYSIYIPGKYKDSWRRLILARRLIRIYIYIYLGANIGWDIGVYIYTYI